MSSADALAYSLRDSWQVRREISVSIRSGCHVDNPGTRKHSNVCLWPRARPRFHLHFTLTSASWLSLVERLFREVTDKRIRRGVYLGMAEGEQAIADCPGVHNHDPKSFV